MVNVVTKKALFSLSHAYVVRLSRKYIFEVAWRRTYYQYLKNCVIIELYRIRIPLITIGDNWISSVDLYSYESLLYLIVGNFKRWQDDPPRKRYAYSRKLSYLANVRRWTREKATAWRLHRDGRSEGRMGPGKPRGADQKRGESPSRMFPITFTSLLSSLPRLPSRAGVWLHRDVGRPVRRKEMHLLSARPASPGAEAWNQRIIKFT